MSKTFSMMAWVLVLASSHLRAEPSSPPALEVRVLHDASAADPMKLLRVEEDGTLHLTGTGRESFMGADDGSFASLTTDAPDWVFTARLRQVPGGTPNPKIGIAVRENTGRLSRSVHLRYDGHAANQALQWFFRYQVSAGGHHGDRRAYLSGVEAEAKEQEGIWLRIEREYPEYRLFRSVDGQTWLPVGAERTFALHALENHVGLMVTAGGNGNTPVTAVFDHVEFKVLPPGAEPRPERAISYQPASRPWDMYLTHVDSEETYQDFFVLKPRDMAWEDVRGFLYSAGSREIVIQEDGVLRKIKFTGEGKLRRPEGMETFEGRLELPPLDPIYEMFAEQGLARLGGAGHPRDLRQALEKLSEVTGYPGVKNMPLLISGMSFAGGYSAMAANAHPEQTIAAAPTHLAAVGWDTPDLAAQQTPRLYVFGSHDTTHLADVNRVTQPVRERGSPWAFAPLWWYHHVIGHTQSIVLPYFFRLADLRLPADADPSKGPVPLNKLREEDGWLGLHDTWQSNDPRIVSWADATEEQRRGPNSWFPDEYTATLWRAFVSDWPRTIIHSPRFDATNAWSGPPGAADAHHRLPEKEPFVLLASGPLGDGLDVSYYDGTRRLTVLRTFRNNPYLVELEGLEAGVHVIYAVTVVDGVREISRPQLIHVQPASHTP